MFGQLIKNRVLTSAAAVAMGLSVAAASPALAGEKDIVDVAVEAGTFKTLVAAVTAADLVDTLKSPGPFTVFAPTDKAFAALPEGTVETLLKPENKDQLVAVLTYHVVPGKVMAADAIKLDGKSAKTVQGSSINISVVDGKVKINDATVVAADVAASNGVVHVIDKVLLPPAPASSDAKPASPAEVIETAIELGAPMYNHGNRAACAAIYQVAMTALVGHEDVSADQRQMLTVALDKAEHQHDAGKQAWIYRRAMDKVHSSMTMTVSASARGCH